MKCELRGEGSVVRKEWRWRWLESAMVKKRAVETGDGEATEAEMWIRSYRRSLMEVLFAGDGSNGLPVMHHQSSKFLSMRETLTAT